MCLQCLSQTGPPSAHGACSLPAHTAQALDCSTGNHPLLALGCLHLPGLSCSGSGTCVVLRGTDSVGPAFCALPRSEQLRQGRQDIYLSFNDEVFGKRGYCNLSPPRRSVIWVYNRRTFSGGCWLQHTKLPCPSTIPGACLNSCPSSWWCHTTISSSLSSPSPPAFSISQHQGLFLWVSSSHGVAKILEFQLQHQSFQCVFRTDFLENWLMWSLCSPRDS